MGGVEYQVTKVDPTDPHTKGAVYQVHKVSEEVAATLGGKVYRARIIKDPTEPTVAGKVYQIVLIGDPSDPAVKGKVYNAILTGGSEAVVVGPAVSPLALSDAVADTLTYVKAFGGTQQGDVPQGYTRLASITNSSAGYLDTGIIADVDDMEFDVVAKINGTASLSWYILQSRAASSAPVYGISGSSSGNTFIGSFSGTNVSARSTIVRQSEHTYHVNSKCQNGTITLTVEDLTDSTSTTNTGTYTFTAATTNIGLFRNLAGGGTLSSGNTSVISAYVKKGGVKVLDYVPALNPSNVVGFYDKVTGTFKVSTGGAFVADQTIVPTPDAPMDIVSNNGVLKYSANIANVNAQTALIGYYISATGVVTADANSWMYQDYIPVSPNTTYTITMSSPVYYVSISEYSTASDSGFVIRKAGSTGTNTTLTITTGATTNFVRFGTNIDRTAVTLEKVLVINWQLNKGNSMPYQPYVEGGLYTDGTVETINVHTKNLFNKNTALLGDVATNGDYVSRTYRVVSDYIPVRFGQTFVGSGTLMDTNGAEYTAAVIKAFYKADKSYITGTRSTVQDGKLTIDNNECAYIRIVFYNTSLVAGKTVSIENSVLQLEQGTTATAYQPYYDGGTATAEMLLAIASDRDVQEIISGNITRKIGVKVLDGSENWVGTTTAGITYYMADLLDNNDFSHLICTHFINDAPMLSDNSVYKSAGSSYLQLRYDDSGSLAGLKQWLTDQYNAGTPVIVLYSLATPTTESVTGQTLQVTDGDNVLEITQASLNGLELEAEYEKEA